MNYMKVYFSENINTKQLMTDFFHSYDRMIILNESFITINNYRYYYNIVIGKSKDFRTSVYNMGLDNSISLTELKNQKLKPVLSYCNSHLVDYINASKTGELHKGIVFFKDVLFIRYQTIHEEWGRSKAAGIIGVKIIRKEALVLSKSSICDNYIVRKTNLYYSIEYDSKEYRIFFDKANSTQQAIDVLNKHLLLPKKEKQKLERYTGNIVFL